MYNSCTQICKKLVAYEKAIDAYQFHVQRYHTWVKLLCDFRWCFICSILYYIVRNNQ